ncbi:MAG: MmgE/PrpD family protein [Betaproteobacteria bacterium]|nr:MmgE/PrpD family protein [Betaproteobacteria bacterium]
MAAAAPASAVTESLAAWLCRTRWSDLPDDVRRKASDVVYDSVGAMIACSQLPEVLALVRFLNKMGGAPECTMIGHLGRTSLVNAAMANGGMSHGDEVDPVHLRSVGGHVASGPAPTALTVGEWTGASGQAVLHAVALGYEVGGRLMTIFYRERDYVARRFYPTAVVAAMSSAVTAGVLLGLGREPMQVALCLAAYQAAGPDNMTRDPAHMGKTFQVAAANRNGVTAALLAQDGCRTPPDILDGSHSLFDAYLGAPDAGAEMLADIGAYYSITDVMHKRYPVGSPNQAYLQGLFGLMEKHAVRPDDIESVEVQIPARGLKRVPTTRHASISALTVCAIAAAHGKLDFYRLHDPAGAMDAAAMDMQKRVRFVGRDDWTDLQAGHRAIVTIRTRGGGALTGEVRHRPMDAAELDRKFRELVEPRLGGEGTDRVGRLLKQLDSAASVKPLMEALQRA